MVVFPVVLDSCVLYPMYLRDTLLCVAEAGLYQVRWSPEILEGAFRNLVKDGRLQPNQAERLERAMKTAFPEAMIQVTPKLIPCMDNHEGDRAVLAAALIGKAHVIVTHNLKHFPFASLRQFNVEAQSPDAFLTSLFDLSPEKVHTALLNQIQGKRKPKLSVADLLGILEKETPTFVNQCRQYLTF